MPELTREQLGVKTRKIIEMNSKQATINSVYFNPIYSTTLSRKVPELKAAGFELHKTEVESVEGTVISARISGPAGDRISLGAVLLDGKDVLVEKELARVETLISFIAED